MFCPKCGTQNTNTAKFCANCGNTLVKANNNFNNSDQHSSSYITNINKNIKNNSSSNIKKIHISKTAKRIIIIVSSSIVLLIVLIIVVNMVFLEPLAKHDQLDRNYKTSLETAKKQKQDIEKKISGCESTLSNVNNSQVKDPSTLSNLKEVLNSVKTEAQNIIINENKPESDSETINVIDQNNTKSQQLKELWFKLNSEEAKVYGSKNDKANEGITLTERMNVTGKDSNGYNIQTIIKTSSWIRASNKDLINRAWKSAGGRTDAPAISNFNKSNEPFNEENSIVLIGSAEFHNKTDNFHISDSNKKNPAINLTLQDTDYKSGGYTTNSNNNSDNIIVKYAVGYSTGNGDNTKYGKIEGGYSGSWRSTYNDFVGADMYKDDWGPVSFMIILNNVFNPNYPSGNPLINRIEFSFNPSYNKLGVNNYIDERLYNFKPQITW